MRVKNLCQNSVADICAKMALDLHSITVEWTEQDHADVLICDAFTNYELIKEYPADLKLCFDLQHAAPDKHRGWSNVGWLSYEHDNIFAVIECEDPGFDNNKILFYDFLWNRSKAYYTNRPWTISNVWYHNGEEAYTLQPISLAEQKTRLFLSPNKIGRPNSPYRSRLTDVVRRYDLADFGYYSAITFDRDSTPALFPNRKNHEISTVRELDIRWPEQATYGYEPVHNAYYNETFFSVYVETFETGTTQFITEKTLDPLLKGHFILPFSSPGFLKYVQRRGWRLPNCIDYSYDDIHDDELRFRKFKDEFLRLSSISMDKWRQMWVDNFDVIQYNRNQLYNRPYDYIGKLNEMQTLP